MQNSNILLKTQQTNPMQNQDTSSKTRQANPTQHFSPPASSQSALSQPAFANLSDKELYKKCQLYGAEARKWTNRFAALLPEVARRELFKKYGFYTISEFAAKLAGIKHEALVEILRVAKKLEDKPLLLNQLAEQGVNKLRLVANVATKENETMLCEKVKEMSKATLATFIQEKFRAGTEFDQNNTTIGSGQTGFIDEEIAAFQSKIPQHITISIPFEPKVELQLRELQKKLSRERGFPVELSEVIKTLMDAYGQRGEMAIKKPLKSAEMQMQKISAQTLQAEAKTTQSQNPKSPSHHIPTKTEKELYQKYSGRCAWPGCIKLPEIFHHMLRFSLNPSHDPNYIVPLCKNHERLAHHGLIENEELSPENWRLRTEPDKNALKYKIDKKVISYYAPRHLV